MHKAENSVKEMLQPQLDFQSLPEGCIATVISLTSPPDACRLSFLSKEIRSAAESDAVWDKFIPPETQITIQSHPNFLSSPPNSKKDLFMTLCDNPVLIDEGTMSFSLDKWSGKKCYMIAPKGLRIAWGDNPQYWQWITLPDSRFEEVAELRGVGWFEIRGRIATHMLSPSTLYEAFLVYKFSRQPNGRRGFEVHPTAVAVSARSFGFDYESPNLSEMVEGGDLKYTAFLARPERKVNEEARLPGNRADGWLEMELGEYFCQGKEDAELEMICCEINNSGKYGIIVQGIEVRPKRN